MSLMLNECCPEQLIKYTCMWIYTLSLYLAVSSWCCFAEQLPISDTEFNLNVFVMYRYKIQVKESFI